MADPSPALQARVEQLLETLNPQRIRGLARGRDSRHQGHAGEWVKFEAVEALVIRLLTEQQRVEAQMQELTKSLARVDERDSSGVLQSSAHTATGDK